MAESKGDGPHTVALDTRLSEDALKERNNQKEIAALQYAAMLLIDNLLMYLDSEDLPLQNPGSIFSLAPLATEEKSITEARDKILLGHMDFPMPNATHCATLLTSILDELRDRGKPLISLSKNEISTEDANTTSLGQHLFYMLNQFMQCTQNPKEQVAISHAICASVVDVSIPFSMQSIITNLILQTTVKPSPSTLQSPTIRLKNTHYEHYTTETKEKEKLFSRFHFFHLLNVTSKGLDPRFSAYKGDVLKSKILEYFKAELESCTTIEQLVQKRGQIEQMPEYKKLNELQGLALYSRIKGKQTSSSEAFDEMVKEQGNNIKEQEQEQEQVQEKPST